MADIHIEYGDVANRICHTMEILVVEEEKRRKHVNQFSTSIYRIPKTLRDVSSNSYTPRVVSIGPFHRQDTTLKGVEMLKMTYMIDLFARLKSPREQTMNACVNMVLAKIDRIKACYEGMTTMTYKDEDEFAKMMVTDGCFILEIVYRSNHKTNESHSFFDNNLLTLYIKHDLLLLENQIPFFVLEDIFECTIGTLQPRASLSKLIRLFLSDMNPFRKEFMLDDEVYTHYDHILGLMQKCYQYPQAISSEHSKTTSNSAAELSNPISYSVSELGLAGVKFKPDKDAKWVLAMEFKSSSWISWFCWSWGKPTFRMPVLQIEDYTESVLRNLVAYEQFSPEIPNYITSYVFAMERLLDTKEDVIKVIESKVLVNNLGSSEQASHMINSICKEVTVKDFTYTKEWQQLEEYYNGYWPKNVAWLRRTYFNTPWSFIALLAGFLLFGLTVAQTYFTIHPT